MRRLAFLLAAFAFLTAGTPSTPEEESHVSLVPWQVLAPGAACDAPLTLFWVPASRDELRRSEMLTSSELTLFASRCVAMRVVRVDDENRLASLDVDEALPVAVLADRQGRILGRVESVDGALSVTAIETMVREELEAREGAAEMLLDDARQCADRGETSAAIAAYEKVCKQRCVCPRQARDAERALKKLKRRP